MATWHDRWRDAQGFWDLARAGYDPKSRYGNPAASNALMAVIAANDAVCLRLGRRQPKGDSHVEAADLLKLACKGTAWEKDASERSRQLLAMLRQKTAVQYLGVPRSLDEQHLQTRTQQRACSDRAAVKRQCPATHTPRAVRPRPTHATDPTG